MLGPILDNSLTNEIKLPGNGSSGTGNVLVSCWIMSAHQHLQNAPTLYNHLSEEISKIEFWVEGGSYKYPARPSL